MFHVTATTRTAIGPNRTEAIFECWNDNGWLRGCSFERTTTELVEPKLWETKEAYQRRVGCEITVEAWKLLIEETVELKNLTV